VNYFSIDLGEKFPEIVNCVVEIPKDTNVKYEYDPNNNIFKVDRCLISAMRYPVNYGFIPQTLADDGDPLDIIIYSRFSFTTGCVSECKIIGGLDMTENGKKDYKIIGVPTFIESVNHIKDLKDDWLEVTRDFFKNYKNVEKKKVTVGKWFTAKKAKQIVKKSFINK
jgi:inorganic pyrophosphatase|tara:strand:- start:7344 stop:7844 length:501 start_codon:yes stop_codon:yes gene_type:complete